MISFINQELVRFAEDIHVPLDLEKELSNNFKVC